MVKDSLSTAVKVPEPSGLVKSFETLSKRIGVPVTVLCGPLGDRPVTQEPVLYPYDELLNDQHKENKLDGPGERAGHVEQLLLPEKLVTHAAGGADKLGHDDNARR